MSFYITTSDIARVCAPDAKTLGSAWRWTRGTPRQRQRKGRGYGSGESYFRLPDLVPALRKRRRLGLSGDELRALVELDGVFDPSEPLGALAVARGQVLRKSLTAAEVERLDRCANSFMKGATYAFFDRVAHVQFADMLDMLPLCRPVLRYVLLRDRSELPDTQEGWADFAAAVILANSDSETVTNLSQ